MAEICSHAESGRSDQNGNMGRPRNKPVDPENRKPIRTQAIPLEVSGERRSDELKAPGYENVGQGGSTVKHRAAEPRGFSANERRIDHADRLRNGNRVQRPGRARRLFRFFNIDRPTRTRGREAHYERQIRASRYGEGGSFSDVALDAKRYAS
jgi:hypothetical protein